MFPLAVSFSWTHHQVRDVITRITPDFDIVEGGARFNFDSETGFLPSTLLENEKWIKRERKEPLPLRDVRED